MNDKIFFNNTIAYMVVGPDGSVNQSGVVKNQTGAQMKDAILRAITGQSGVAPGTIVGVASMAFRTDGSAILGTLLTWSMSTAFSTRYNSATYVNSVNFNGTYTATANVNVKTVALLDYTPHGNDESGSFVHFYSTNMNMSVGSAGKIIIQWTVSM